MEMLRSQAYEVLELPNGADADSIRTAYKRLALRYHPDKSGNSASATKKFQDISTAYKKLTSDGYDSDDEIQMTMAEMFNLFQHIFAPPPGAFSNGYDSSDDDDDDDDDDLDELYFGRRLEKDISGKILTAEAGRSRVILPSKHHSRNAVGAGINAEIERNANELITEEEKEKRKQEKRRAKKKRQREKKRIEKEQHKKEEEQNKKGSGKQNGEVKTESKKSKKDKKHKDSSASEGEFDEKAAFFTKVINKKKKAGVVPEVTSNGKRKEKEKAAVSKDEDSMHDPIVLRSRQLAIRGNQMANSGHYPAAIDLFTEAIKLDPKDFRFFGNRSYCYDRLEQYDRALRDADKAISIAPDWPKGYFRKGRALAGLKLHAEAETAFTQVLKLDRNCQEAVEEQLRVRTLQLTEMGFSQQQAQSAIKQYGNVQQALDSLLAGHAAESSIAGEVYMSDEEEVETTPAPAPQRVPYIQISHPPLPCQQKDTKMDPNNPEGLTALWVGNVLREVTEDKLKVMFSKFGPVTSVRCLPDKYCAFINYKTKEAAGKALAGLQGVECAGQRLLIKFPDNPITNNGNVVIRKNGPAQSTAATVKSGSAQKPGDQKQTGPVNGDECYFWRTTGCIYGNTCRYRHLPKSKGQDLKPWQKNS